MTESKVKKHPKKISPASPPATKMTMFYDGLVVIGAFTVVLVLCNLAIKKWCAGATVSVEEEGTRMRPAAETRNRRESSRYLLHSFRYKKSEQVKDVGEVECAVCLSAFEDDEEVKRLDGCNHSFHADCIDKWLHSHPDCPLCRAYVAEQPPAERSGEGSRGGLIGSTSISVEGS